MFLNFLTSKKRFKNKFFLIFEPLQIFFTEMEKKSNYPDVMRCAWKIDIKYKILSCLMKF